MFLSSVVYALSAAIGVGIAKYAAARSSSRIGYFCIALLTQVIGALVIIMLPLRDLWLIVRFLRQSDLAQDLERYGEKLGVLLPGDL
jgi:hypothetical protein